MEHNRTHMNDCGPRLQCVWLLVTRHVLFLTIISIVSWERRVFVLIVICWFNGGKRFFFLHGGPRRGSVSLYAFLETTHVLYIVTFICLQKE